MMKNRKIFIKGTDITRPYWKKLQQQQHPHHKTQVSPALNPIPMKVLRIQVPQIRYYNLEEIKDMEAFQKPCSFFDDYSYSREIKMLFLFQSLFL
jgi:hypothetical protein